MTRALLPREVADVVQRHIAGAVAEVTDKDLVVTSERLLEVAGVVSIEPGLAFDYLVQLTSVDYIDYFEMVYRLTSMKHNHGMVLKARIFDREAPTISSVISVWRGAELQEREVYDLMGIRFTGHPNLKRIVLWEGFEGHPLRKDFLLQRP